MPSFFTQYNSFESRLEAAMNAGDVKLVQILLGPEYCQVWQYWAVHAIISHNMLAMERAGSHKLPLNIYIKMISELEKQRKLLDKQKKFLEGKENEAAKGIIETRKLLKKLFDITRDEAKEYRGKIAEANRVVDGAHHLFHVPGEAGHVPYYIADNLEQASSQNSCQSLMGRNRPAFSYESALGCVSSALKSIDKVTKTKVVHECDLLTEVTEKIIDKEVCQDVGKLTRVLHYLDTGDYWLNGDNAQALDDVINNIPERIPDGVFRAANLIPGAEAVSRLARAIPVSPRSIARGTIIALRHTLGEVLGFLENKYDDISKLDCVEKKITQTENMIECFIKLRDDKQRMNEKLYKAEKDIERNVLDQLLDGKPIKKYFVEQMYDKLLNRYLNYFFKEEERPFYNEQFKPSTLLLEDINRWKNECGNDDKCAERIKNAIRKEIESKPRDYGKFKDILANEIRKTNPNLDVMSVLIANCANAVGMKEMLLGKLDPNVGKFITKSPDTIIMEAHDMLFDFYKYDNTLALASVFPTKLGEFERTSTDRIVWDNTGEKNFQALAKEFVRFMGDMEKRREKGQLGRYHYKSVELFYWAFFDLFRFKRRESASRNEYSEIDRAMAEFCDIVTYAPVCDGQGMMYDYIEKIKQRALNEKNRDVQGLYRVITGQTWRGWWNSWWNDNFKETSGDCGIANFLKEMEEAINKLIEEEKEAKDKESGVRMQQANERAEQETQRAEQETRRAEQETRRAEQETRRAEQIKIIGGVFTKKMFKLNDEELRDVVADSQGEIVEAITRHVMEHDSSPGQVLDAIIEEVISNRDQVMREGAVGDELIKAGIRSFSSQGTLLSDVNVSQGAGVSR